MSKYCSYCGNELAKGESICQKCGRKVEDTNATISVVSGIIGIFFSGIVLGIVAIVEANISRSKNDKHFSSTAKRGLVLGVIDIVGVIIAIIIRHYVG